MIRMMMKTLAPACATALLLGALGGRPLRAEVNSDVDHVVYSGDGTTKAFTFPFGIFAPSELRVVLRTVATGTESVQTINSHYTLGDDDADGDYWDGPGGTVTFATAPASGVQVWISRAPPLTQTTDIDGSAYVRLNVLEDAVDKLATRIQYLRGLQWRALVAQETDRQRVDMNLPAGWSLGTGSPWWDGDSWGMRSTDLTDTAASEYWGNVLTEPTLAGSVTALGGASAIRPLLAVGVINVTDAPYNATGDGVTDDTAAIQAAATAAAAANSILYFPTPTVSYKVSGKLVDNQSLEIRGSGQWDCLIDCTGYNGVVFDLGPYSRICDLKIDGGDAATGATAITSSANWYDSRAERLFIYRVGTAFSVINAWGSTIDDVMAVTVGNGIKATFFHGSQLSNCYVLNYTGYGIHIRRGKAFHAQNLILENGGTYGLILERCFASEINGLYFEGTRTAGYPDIYFGAQAAVLCNNITIRNAYMNSNSDTDVAPIHVAYGTGVTLGNFHWETPTTGYFPYYIDNSSPFNVKRAVRCLNWTRNAGDDGIPLARYNDYVIYDGLGGLDNPAETDFLDVADGEGKVPRVLKFDYTNGLLETNKLGISVKNGSTSAGYVDFYEDSDHGTNYVRLQPSAAIGADRTFDLLTTGFVKVVCKTIDLDDDASTDDHQFDDDAANTNKQVITLTDILPAYAELISVQLRCFETVTGSATMSIGIGTTSGGDELLAAANTDSANDINTTAAGAAPLLAATNAARSVYVSATPGANWNTLDAGRWAIMLTYIDYGAVYSQKNP